MGPTTHSAVFPAGRLSLVDSPAIQYPPARPVTVTVLQNRRLTPADYSEDVHHIVFDLKGIDLIFTEGQSIGIIPPGFERNGRPHRPRFFNIASPVSGEPGFGPSFSICVKRNFFETDAGDAQPGMCSNYLCDLAEGSQVPVTGPIGKSFALPRDADVDLLCFATGTGISPFRGFLFRLFNNGTGHSGSVHLFYGSRTRHDHLFANELNRDLLRWQNEPGFWLHSALSREAPDHRIHIGDLLQARGEMIEAVLDRRNYAVYICGLRGMEKEIEAFFRSYLADRSGEYPDDARWAEIKEQLKHAGRWAQEVY